MSHHRNNDINDLSKFQSVIDHDKKILEKCRNTYPPIVKTGVIVISSFADLDYEINDLEKFQVIDHNSITPTTPLELGQTKKEILNDYLTYKTNEKEKELSDDKINAVETTEEVQTKDTVIEM